MYNARRSDEPQCARPRYMSHTFRGTSHGVTRNLSPSIPLFSERARVRLDANLVETDLDRRRASSCRSYCLKFFNWSLMISHISARLSRGSPASSRRLRKIEIIIPENSMTAEEFAATPSRNYILLLGTIGIIMTRVLRHYN